MPVKGEIILRNQESSLSQAFCLHPAALVLFELMGIFLLTSVALVHMAKSLLAISCDGLLTACDLKVTVEKPVHKSGLAAAMSRQVSGKVHSLRPSCQAERQNPTSCSGDLHTIMFKPKGLFNCTWKI